MITVRAVLPVCLLAAAVLAEPPTFGSGGFDINSISSYLDDDTSASTKDFVPSSPKSSSHSYSSFNSGGSGKYSSSPVGSSVVGASYSSAPQYSGVETGHSALHGLYKASPASHKGYSALDAAPEYSSHQAAGHFSDYSASPTTYHGGASSSFSSTHGPAAGHGFQSPSHGYQSAGLVQGQGYAPHPSHASFPAGHSSFGGHSASFGAPAASFGGHSSFGGPASPSFGGHSSFGGQSSFGGHSSFGGPSVGSFGHSGSYSSPPSYSTHPASFGGSSSFGSAPFGSPAYGGADTFSGYKGSYKPSFPKGSYSSESGYNKGYSPSHRYRRYPQRVPSYKPGPGPYAAPSEAGPSYRPAPYRYQGFRAPSSPFFEDSSML